MTPGNSSRSIQQWCALLSACLVFAGACSAGPRLGPAIPDHKKIIGFAVNTVEPAYLKEHIADIEKLPLDGLVIFVYPDDWGPRRSGQEDMFFGGRQFTHDDFSKARADLKATRFTSLTDNFIHVATSARGSGVTGKAEDGNIDWFDPNWSGIAKNGAVVASLAKDAGFKGMFLDVEHYLGTLGPYKGHDIFDYNACPSKDKYTFDQVAAQVRHRGRQFIEAVTGVYPTITIMVIQNTGWGRSNLVDSFVRGMMERRGKATIIDGGEGTYSAIVHQEFTDMRTLASGYHRDPVYDGLQYAFGVWVDPTPNKYGGWHTDPAEFHMNYRSPQEFENTLYSALTTADKYVWLFVWHPNVWFTPIVRPRPMLGQCVLCPHEKVPDAYVQALRDCRKPHDLNWRPEVASNRFVYFDDAVLVEGDKITADSPNLLKNPGFETWTGGPDKQPDAWNLKGQGPAIFREQNVVKSGKCAARLTCIRPAGHVFFDQHLPASAYRGKTITFGAWVRSDTGGGLQIFDFIGGEPGAKATSSLDVAKLGTPEAASGTPYPGDGQWHFLTATKTIRPDATGEVWLRLGARMTHQPGTTGTAGQ